MTLKKKKKRFQLLSSQNNGSQGSEGGQDRTKPATLGSQQQSLHLEDLTRGSWDAAAPEKVQGYMVQSSFCLSQ